MPVSCDPNDLAAASRCYCFDAETRKRVKLYLLAVAAGLGNQTPQQLVDASRCFCFDKKQARSIELYLLCQAASALNVQDMLLDWTPSSVQFGNYIGLRFISRNAGVTNLVWRGAAGGTSPYGTVIQFQAANDLLTFSAPNLVTWDGSGALTFINCTAITSISLPLLATVPAGAPTFTGNTALTTLNLASLQSAGLGMSTANSTLLSNLTLGPLVLTNTKVYNFSNCALPSATVNYILARGVASASFVTGTINLNGGTNGAPTGQGIADKATLIGRGCTVSTN